MDRDDETAGGRAARLRLSEAAQASAVEREVVGLGKVHIALSTKKEGGVAIQVFPVAVSGAWRYWSSEVVGSEASVDEMWTYRPKRLNEEGKQELREKFKTVAEEYMVEARALGQVRVMEAAQREVAWQDLQARRDEIAEELGWAKEEREDLERQQQTLEAWLEGEEAFDDALSRSEEVEREIAEVRGRVLGWQQADREMELQQTALRVEDEVAGTIQGAGATLSGL